MTRRRARSALAGDARTWIVRKATDVRLDARELAFLSSAGVRWAALSPIRVVAVAATPGLARARARWKRLVPPGAAVWVIRG